MGNSQLMIKTEKHGLQLDPLLRFQKIQNQTEIVLPELNPLDAQPYGVLLKFGHMLVCFLSHMEIKSTQVETRNGLLRQVPEMGKHLDFHIEGFV